MYNVFFVNRNRTCYSLVKYVFSSRIYRICRIPPITLQDLPYNFLVRKPLRVKISEDISRKYNKRGGGVTNFDFLKDIPQFAAFADVAVAAEKILMIDPEASVMNCRRAMEFAVKWMYSVDDMLVMPYQDKLVSLLNTEEFKRNCGCRHFAENGFYSQGGKSGWHIREES